MFQICKISPTLLISVYLKIQVGLSSVHSFEVEPHVSNNSIKLSSFGSIEAQQIPVQHGHTSPSILIFRTSIISCGCEKRAFVISDLTNEFSIAWLPHSNCWHVPVIGIFLIVIFLQFRRKIQEYWSKFFHLKSPVWQWVA